jgi:TolA-binding protein
MVNSIKQADNQLRQLRKQIRALRADEKLKDAVKRQRIERLEDRMLRIMEAARGRYNTLKE